MPLYEYKCESCGKTFETIQKFSDAPLEVHDECGGKVIRLVSPSALHFKGSGWYVTDYAGSKNGGDKGDKSKGKDGKKESTTAGGSSAKSETKTSSSPPASSSDKSDKKV